jgi:GNAT superfamily N-acetyltransferase
VSPPASEAAVIRAAVASDLPVLRDVAYRSKAFWGYDQAFMDAVESSLAPEEHELAEGAFVIAHGGVITGFYAFKTIEGTFFLYSLFVVPEKIGCGVGRRLWQHSVDFARRTAHGHFMIESDPNAEEFYVHMGARRVGEIVSAVSGRSLPLLRFECPTRHAPA